MHATSRGFTLIELSIVLVIIGLIVGGVLVGQDLIKAATTRKIISEKDTIETAVRTFQGKYNCLPGDCPNATQFWGAAVAGSCSFLGSPLVNGGPTCNGNGNGLIEWGDGVPQEVGFFWHHLYNAGLISLPYPSQLGMNLDISSPYGSNGAKVPGQTNPLSSTGIGAWEAVYWNDARIIQQVGACNYAESTFAGSCWSQPNVLEFSSENNLMPFWGGGGDAPALTPAMAYSIDAKIDDGKPDQGSIRTSWGGTCTVTDGSGVMSYNLTDGTIQCSFAYLAGW